MKRKPNKPKQEPRERPGSWESAADPGGAGAADSGTSGQSVQNMGYPAKSKDFVGRGGATERADFGGSAAEGAKAKFATTKFRQKSKQEQAAASKLRMEERGKSWNGQRISWQNRSRPKSPARCGG